MLMQNVKPVLRKNINHQGNNVILMFKSIEIYLIDSESEKAKVPTPVYVPVAYLKELLSLPKK